MAGIYLHIPFCKQACYYCDFHFSTNTQVRKELIGAMNEEISLQRNYLGGEDVHTIYFGGGTPSLLDEQEIGSLIMAISRYHRVLPEAEITLEANPDDLIPGKLRALKAIGINRLSIGIQSFDDTMLTYLNRAHSADNAIQSVHDALEAGFNNVSIDLIYAIPGLTDDRWAEDIETALDLGVQHISAYTLTIEEKTAFGKWVVNGKMQPVSEPVAAAQMELLVSRLSSRGYRQYEISNFALPGFESQHNMNYWKGGKYLGIGPSAHSYDQSARQHNVSNNHLYVGALKVGRIPAEQEILTKSELINEYILTALRTDQGCNLDLLRERFGYDVTTLHSGYLHQLQDNKLIILADHHLRLTDAGRLLADKISSDLFLVE